MLFSNSASFTGKIWGIIVSGFGFGVGLMGLRRGKEGFSLGMAEVDATALPSSSEEEGTALLAGAICLGL